jgi:hypothetical protein
VQLLVRAGHAVDVVPEVRVRVEDVRAARQQVPQLVVVGRDQLVGSPERCLHEA